MYLTARRVSMAEVSGGKYVGGGSDRKVESSGAGAYVPD